MKRLLLDTHIFLWWLTEDPALHKHVKQTIIDSGNQVYISAATIWEISIKQTLGKLTLPEDMERDMEKVVEEEHFLKLPISLYHAQIAGGLHKIHKDPFDRMLIAQAQAQRLLLVTDDMQIKKYPVQVLSN